MTEERSTAGVKGRDLGERSSVRPGPACDVAARSLAAWQVRRERETTEGRGRRGENEGRGGREEGGEEEERERRERRKRRGREECMQECIEEGGG